MELETFDISVGDGISLPLPISSLSSIKQENIEASQSFGSGEFHSLRSAQRNNGQLLLAKV